MDTQVKETEAVEAQKSLPLSTPEAKSNGAAKPSKKKAAPNAKKSKVKAKKAASKKVAKEEKLLPKRKAVVGTGSMLFLDPRAIIVRQGWNPRIDMGDMKGLANQIKSEGKVHRPVVVRKAGDNQYLLIDGHRRVIAAISAGITKVPAMLSTTKEEKREILSTVFLNDGKPLLPVEEAQAFRKALELGATQREIATATGRSFMHIKNRLDLIAAHPDVIKAVAEKKIPVQLGVEIARANKDDKATQKRLVKQAATGKQGKKIVAEELGKKDYGVIINKAQVALENRMRKLVDVVNNKDATAKLKPILERLISRFDRHANYEFRLAYVAGGVAALGDVVCIKTTRKERKKRSK